MTQATWWGLLGGVAVAPSSVTLGRNSQGRHGVLLVNAFHSPKCSEDIRGTLERTLVRSTACGAQDAPAPFSAANAERWEGAFSS